ncbi:MAG TPA: SDR family NAD(P)-dependent oxidoreductase, partial [Myxococcota bacterium]
GGSRGLGLVIARTIVARGGRVCLVARDADELERAERDLVERGGDVLPIVGDVTQEGFAAQCVQACVGAFGALDVVINNAGLITVGPVESMRKRDYEAAMDLHFWAPLAFVEAALPELKARGGRVVNISSIGGKIAVPHMLPYSASKFALTGWSEGLRAELLKDGVAVTTVCPPLMRTGSPRHAQFKGHHEDEHTWFTLAASVPGVSMAAETAAARIVDALERGNPEVLLSAPFRLAAAFHGAFPGTTTTLMALATRLLPDVDDDDGAGSEAKEGKDVGSAWAPSAFTMLNEIAALKNNEH